MRLYISVAVVLLVGVALTGPAIAENYVSNQNGSWGTSTIWTPQGIPGASDNVTVNHNVTVDADRACLNITIGGTGTLTCAGAYVLTVYGDWTNNGATNLTNGVVTFAGTAPASIGGSKTTSFYRLYVCKDVRATTVTMNADVNVVANVAYALCVQVGTLRTNNYNLTVSSTNDQAVRDSSNASTNSQLTIDGTTNTVTIAGQLYQFGGSGTGYGYVTISGSPTVLIGKHYLVNAYRGFTMNGGKLTYTSSTGNSLYMTGHNSTDAGCWINGGKVYLRASVFHGINSRFIVTAPAEIHFEGSSNAILTLHGTPTAVTYNSLFIEKTGGAQLTCSTDVYTYATNRSLTANSVTINAGAVLRLSNSGSVGFGAGYGFEFGNVTNNGTVVLGNCASGYTGPLILSGSVDGAGTWDYDPARPGTITFKGTGTCTFASGVPSRFYDVVVNKTGSLECDNDITIGNSLMVAAGTFSMDNSTLTLGTTGAWGSVTVASGAAFNAVGTGFGRAGVKAQSASYPYAFTVQNGGTIGAKYADFQYMNTSGISVASGATVNAANNFSYCTFDHGSISGPMLKIENNQTLDDIFDVSFSGSAGSNIEKLAATGHISVNGNPLGDRWGPDFESDPNGRIDWLAYPAGFELLAPVDGAKGVPLDQVLSWEESERATNYAVYYGVSLPPDSVYVTGLQYAPPDLVENTTYQWTVVARNAYGRMPTTSGTWTFKTALVSKPVLQQPADGDTTKHPTAQRPTFEWSDLGLPGVSYDIEIDNNDDFLSPEYTDYDVATNSWTPGEDIAEGHWYWRVRGDNGAPGPWCESFFDVFIDLTPPPRPEPVSPLGGAVVPTKLPLLDWKPVPEAREFTVKLYDASHNELWSETFAQAAGGDVSQYQLVSGQELENGCIYSWHVRAKDYAGNASDFSPEQAFIVTLGAPGAGAWEEMPNVPHVAPASTKEVKDGGWLALGPDKEKDVEVIYVAKGNKATDFFKFTPDEDSGTWTALALIPANEGTKPKPPSKGCVGVSDGERYVYMTKGNNTLGFWRYDIEANQWDSMTGVPLGRYNKRVKGGTDMVFASYKDTGCVYLLKGYKTEFYRYNPVAGRWDTLPEVPYGANKQKYDKGSFLVYDGASYIYAHQSKYYDKTQENPHHYMFKYDVAADSWYKAALPGIPVYGLEGGRTKKKKSADGAAGAWYDGSMYALKGGNTQGYYKYLPTPTDTWIELDTVPGNGTTGRKKRVKSGGDIVSYGEGVFFALKGNKTHEFWRYVLPTAYSLQPAAERSGVQAGKSAVGSLQLAISPNPIANGWATVRYSLPKPGPVVVTVFDVAGRAVHQRMLAGNRAGTVALDLRKLASGVYLVRLDASDLSQTQKLVVQR
ncbi:MAG: T9SS type A sorting domain-containing protein [candidate division WOR-3 bacterium]